MITTTTANRGVGTTAERAATASVPATSKANAKAITTSKHAWKVEFGVSTTDELASRKQIDGTKQHLAARTLAAMVVGEHTLLVFP